MIWDKRITIAFILCFSLALIGHGVSLGAQTIPQVGSIVGTMQNPPKAGQGLSFDGPPSQISWIGASYRLLGALGPTLVYVSRDKRNFAWGKSNIVINPKFWRFETVTLEYRVIDGRPSYYVARSDGLWFLFSFPDEPIPVARFVQDFASCWSFFETKNPKAPLEEVFPSLVGTLP